MVAIFSLKRRQARGASASAVMSTLVTRKATSRFSWSTRSATEASWCSFSPVSNSGERFLVLLVAVEIAGDQEQRVAALDRVGRFDVGVVGGGLDMVVRGAGVQRLRQPQPDQPVIGAVGDRLGQIVDRLRIALGAVSASASRRSRGISAGCRLLAGIAVEQLLAVRLGGFGQLFRAVLLRRAAGEATESISDRTRSIDTPAASS